MEENLLKYQCPCCNAPLQFDAISQKVKCFACNNEFEKSVLEEYRIALEDMDTQPEIDWTEVTMQDMVPMEEQKGYICQSCGAEIVADANTSATECLYCGNPVVLPKQVSGMFQPDYIVPFKLDKETAKKRLMNFYKGKYLLPKEFKDSNRIEHMQGMYVPFWLFDCNSSGTVNYMGTRSSSWSDAKNIYTKTSYYSLLRSGSINFNRVPVDASSKMEDEYMDGVEPFDYREMKPFDTMYMAGYFADKFDVTVDDTKERIQLRVENSLKDQLRTTVVGYNGVTVKQANVSMHMKDVRYALMPVWVLNTKYNGENYKFIMNGQTGKVAGKLPIDKKKMWLTAIGEFVGLTVALSAFFLLFF